MRKNGFTLIELIVVIAIVAILAGVAIPILRGQTDSAKWSEAKTGMGSIATALRCYAFNNGAGGTYPPSFADLGFTDSDLTGAYFVIGDYSITEASFTVGGSPELTFIIQCDKADLSPTRMTLDEAGTFTAEDS
jgi:prepilin-type N-terminal cleavage/methylation domain-containing protein